MGKCNFIKKMTLETKVVIAFVGICILTLGFLLSWFINSHAPWETENYPKISQMIAEADNFVSLKEFQKGISKYEGILKLIENREIKKKYLKDLIKDTIISHENAKKNYIFYEEEITVNWINSIQPLLEKANLSLKSNEYDEAIGIYKKILSSKPNINTNIEKYNSMVSDINNSIKSIQEKVATGELVSLPEYSVLRKWKPYNRKNSLGMEILLIDDLNEKQIVSFIKHLSKGKSHVIINIFTDKTVWENGQNNIFDDEESIKKHHILFYMRNPDARTKSDEITWMQEIGRFSQLYGKTTPLSSLSGKEGLRAQVKFTGSSFVIRNENRFDWRDVTFKIYQGGLKDGYFYKVSIVSSQTAYTVGAMQFVKRNGVRFNPFKEKPKNFSIQCTTPNGKEWHNDTFK